MSELEAEMEAEIRNLAAYCQSGSLNEDGLREQIDSIIMLGVCHNYGHTLPLDQLLILVSINERVTEGMIRVFLEYFPRASSKVSPESGVMPIHMACTNKNITLNIIHSSLIQPPNLSDRQTATVGCQFITSVSIKFGIKRWNWIF